MAYNKNYNGNQQDKKEPPAYLESYATVNERVLKFRQDYKDGIIDPEIIKWTDSGVIVIQVKIYKTPEDLKNGQYCAKAHAYEKDGTGYINKTSALENCETSAIGRALSMMGYDIKKSIASLEEMKNALAQQEAERKAQAAKQSSKKGAHRRQAETQPKTQTTAKQVPPTTELTTQPITQQTKKEIERIWFSFGSKKEELNKQTLKKYGKGLVQLSEVEGQEVLKNLEAIKEEAKEVAKKYDTIFEEAKKQTSNDNKNTKGNDAA